MYITCQECETTFRLDESLLKPTGSKVRCSQCKNIFIAAPPAPIVTGVPEPAPAQALYAAPHPEDTADQELTGIDLAELDSLLGQDRSEPSRPAAGEPIAAFDDSEDEPISAAMDDEYEIDFDAALKADSPSPSAPAEDLLEDLNLDMDFELDEIESGLEESPAAPTYSSTGGQKPADPPMTALPQDQDGLSEFELNLEEINLASDGEATVFADMGTEQSSNDGDKLELDLDFDPDATLLAPTQDAAPAEGLSEIELDLDDQLELELDLDDVPQPAAAAGQKKETQLDELGDLHGDDLVLSDLDAILDEASLQEDLEPREEVELALDLESESPAAKEPTPAGSADDDLEELAFELDAEYEDKPIVHSEESAPAIPMEDDEIDLTEIELMLEGGIDDLEPSGVGRTLQPTGDLGLDDGEIDLSDLEAALDSADSDSVDKTADISDAELNLAFDAGEEPNLEMEFDLDLDQLPEVEPAAAEAELDLEMASNAGATQNAADDEFDLTDLDTILLDDEAATKAEVIRSDDIELEFQIDAEQAETLAPSHGQLDTITPESAPILDETPIISAPSEKTGPAKTRPPKKKSSNTLLIFFILILLGAIGYGVYYAVTELGIQIPYVSDYLNPPPKDAAGIANLSTLDINSKFIETEESGRLFVITGKVHNAYSQSRGQIRLQGKLFTKGKVLAQTEYAYAGNILDDQELVTIPKAEIKSRLATPGQRGTAAANQNLPFMVIFSDLPAADDLDEFAVEIVSSAPAQ